MRRKRFRLKNGFANITADLLRYVFFISFSFVLLYPFVYIIINSFKSFSDTYDPTVVWVPKNISAENLSYAVKCFNAVSAFANTFFYEIGASIVQFCSCAVAAYGLSRYKFKGRGILTGIMILTILVPSMMIITPSYVNFSHMDFFGILGLVNRLTGTDLRPNLIGTPLVFYLPSLLGVGLKGGLFIYIYSQFFKSLPKELEEAAWVDGAGPWKTFLKIVIPASGSAFITVLLFSVVWHWNDYYLAQMYMSENPTFSVALNNFSSNTVMAALGVDANTAMMMSLPVLLAGCLMYVLPLIIFYILIQRKFIASIATSGIVG